MIQKLSLIEKKLEGCHTDVIIGDNCIRIIIYNKENDPEITITKYTDGWRLLFIYPSLKLIKDAYNIYGYTIRNDIEHYKIINILEETIKSIILYKNEL